MKVDPSLRPWRSTAEGLEGFRKRLTKDKLDRLAEPRRSAAESEERMGWFDWFRKPKPTVPLPQLCYDVAYFILPHYAFRDLDKLADLCLNAPTAAGPFFYVMAAQARKVEPDPEDAKRFRWRHGQLDEDREYFALEYPIPPPIDMSDVRIEQVVARGTAFVLAPHFSAIIRGRGAAQYFILGQAPMGGGTTLRCILPE
jgi:hypothetical protein